VSWTPSRRSRTWHIHTDSLLPLIHGFPRSLALSFYRSVPAEHVSGVVHRVAAKHGKAKQSKANHCIAFLCICITASDQFCLRLLPYPYYLHHPSSFFPPRFLHTLTAPSKTPSPRLQTSRSTHRHSNSPLQPHTPPPPYTTHPSAHPRSSPHL